MAGLREKLLSARGKLRREPVDVPELADVLGGERLYVTELTAGQLDYWEEQRYQRDGKGVKLVLQDSRALLVVLALTDEAGNRVFADDDVPAVSALPGLMVSRIVAAAQPLSGIGEAGPEKNGTPSPTPTAPSGLPTASP